MIPLVSSFDHGSDESVEKLGGPFLGVPVPSSVLGSVLGPLVYGNPHIAEGPDTRLLRTSAPKAIIILVFKP